MKIYLKILIEKILIGKKPPPPSDSVVWKERRMKNTFHVSASQHEERI